MKIAYILLALLVCLPITLAENVSVTTGPFKISFDMGFPHDSNSYTIGIKDPVEKESLGGGSETAAAHPAASYGASEAPPH